jgi:hypothetical protein
MSYFELYGERVTDETFAQLCQYSNLTEVHLVCTAISNAGFAQVTKLKNLIWLNLDASTGICGDGLLCIEQLTKLQGLSLEGLTGVSRVLPRLSELQHLEYLNLGKSDVDDEALAALPALPKLRTLRLDDTSVSLPGLLSLKKLPSLVTLGLIRTGVSNTAADELKQHFPGCDIGVEGWKGHPFAAISKFLLSQEELSVLKVRKESN